MCSAFKLTYLILHSSNARTILLSRRNTFFFKNPVTGQNIILVNTTLKLLILIQINQFFALICFSLSPVMRLLCTKRKSWRSTYLLQTKDTLLETRKNKSRRKIDWFELILKVLKLYVPVLYAVPLLDKNIKKY